jgi:hypothetical protein
VNGYLLLLLKWTGWIVNLFGHTTSIRFVHRVIEAVTKCQCTFRVFDNYIHKQIGKSRSTSNSNNVV